MFYTFGWREEEAPERDLAQDRARGELAARAICDRCEPRDYERVAGSIWRVRAGEQCLMVDAEEFSTRTQPYSGIAVVACP